jgi:hypothetical protein
MRSILIFVVVVAAALGAYTLFSKEADKPGPRAGQQQTYQAPTTQRPQVDSGKTGVVKGGEFSVQMPEGMEARVEAGVFSWRDTVSEDYLVRMEDAWDVDLSGVDFSKETLCRVGGVDITRDDLRAWICLKYGQAVINPAFYAEIGKMAAAETGIPYGMTDEQWETYFSDWLAQKGVDKDFALNNLAVQMRIPADAVESVRRNMVEAVLACFPPVETVSELPVGLGEAFTSDDQMKQAASLGMLMRETVSKLKAEQGRADAPIAALVDPMSVLFSTAGADIRFRRTWSTLTHELPPGTLAAIYTGPMEGDGILPPWEYPGDRALISIDEVWSLLESGIKPALMRSELREVIWSKVLKEKLRQEGNLPDSRATWLLYADDYLAHKVTFFNMDFVMTQRGYPARSFYLDDLRITTGFAASQGAGWDDEGKLREFFDHNGFFVLGWDPDFELALFVPRDLSQGFDAPEDWGKALEDAQAFEARLEAGESFTKLRTQHNRELVEAYRALNQALGDDFAQKFGTGEFKTTMKMANQILNESLYQDHIDGVSPLRNAVVRLDAGDVSPPWKTPVGYVVIRMNGANLGRLEREFEDVIDLTRAEYASWALRDWVTKSLAGLTVELP